VKLAVFPAAATDTDEGTGSADVLFDASETAIPPAGAT
jgi:hypothetical protein